MHFIATKTQILYSEGKKRPKTNDGKLTIVKQSLRDIFVNLTILGRFQNFKPEI